MHPPKWFMYACILAFGVTLVYSFVAIVNVALKHRTQSTLRQLEQAKEQKAVADSLSTAAIKQLDVIQQQRAIDSLAYQGKKNTLLSNFQTQQKEHEANLAAIDTISDSAVNRRFSVRQMLSDSAVKLWR